MFNLSEPVVNIATTALHQNQLVAVLGKIQLVGFQPMNNPNEYEITIKRHLNFFDKNNPAELLFSLEVPYLLEIGIEDELKDVKRMQNLENFSRNVLEVSEGIRLFNNEDKEIVLDHSEDVDLNKVNWLSHSFLHQLCHNSVFGEFLYDDDPQYQFLEGDVENAKVLSKLDLEDDLKLNLHLVAVDYLAQTSQTS